MTEVILSIDTMNWGNLEVSRKSLLILQPDTEAPGGGRAAALCLLKLAAPAVHEPGHIETHPFLTPSGLPERNSATAGITTMTATTSGPGSQGQGPHWWITSCLASPVWV